MLRNCEQANYKDNVCLGFKTVLLGKKISWKGGWEGGLLECLLILSEGNLMKEKISSDN